MSNLMRVPVVVISAHTEKEIVNQCLEYGIREFIKKSFEDFDRIKERLRKIPSVSKALFLEDLYENAKSATY